MGAVARLVVCVRAKLYLAYYLPAVPTNLKSHDKSSLLYVASLPLFHLAKIPYIPTLMNAHTNIQKK